MDFGGQVRESEWMAKRVVSTSSKESPDEAALSILVQAIYPSSYTPTRGVPTPLLVKVGSFARAPRGLSVLSN